MLRDLFYGVSEQGKAGKHRMDDARRLLNAVRSARCDVHGRLIPWNAC